jgi:hypothetical protein
MIPNHQQLLGLLLRADPPFLAGDFATEFPAAPDREGEQGTFLYFRGGYWYMRTNGGCWFLQSPAGSRVIQLNGAIDDGPVINLQRRPPWSLVLPRCSTLLGSEDDDWQLNAAVPVAEVGPSWVAALTSLKTPESTGSLTVSSTTHVITRVEAGPMVQTLVVARADPTPEDVLALEVIRTVGLT